MEAPVAQFIAAKRGVMIALAGTPIANRLRGRGRKSVWTGEPNPQLFSEHAHLLIPDANGVGVPIYASHPGTAVSPSSWDGEQGAASPTITRTL